MDGGRIAEQGTHEALIETGGLYYKLYEQQLAAGDLL
jgi:ABC-type multidrug transport system fused ATPase/permease subunit